MIRTQLYLTKNEKQGIEAAAMMQGVSQSDLIRRAIDDLLAKAGKTDKGRILDEIAGVWSDKNDLPDIRELRGAWRGRASR
jgi:hypothetical protein